jgi:hypothetical protein
MVRLGLYPGTWAGDAETPETVSQTGQPCDGARPGDDEVRFAA